MDAKRPTQRHVGILERQIRLEPGGYPKHDSQYPPPFPCISVSQEQGFGEASCTPSKLKTEKTLTDSNVRYRHGRRLPRLHDLSNKVTPPSKRPPSSGAFIPSPPPFLKLRIIKTAAHTATNISPRQCFR